MKLAYVSRSARPRSGGIEAHLDGVASGLADRGHALRVWAARIDDAPFTRTNTTIDAQSFPPFGRNGFETSPIPLTTLDRALMSPVRLAAVRGADRLGYDRMRRIGRPLIVWRTAPGLRRQMAGSDLVHAWGGEPLMHAALRAAQDLKLPFVVTPFAHPGHWGDDPLNARLYRDARAVIALLPSEADFYASLGVDPSWVHVIPVAAPACPAGAASAGDVRARHGIGGPLVLCLGVKRRYKYRALLDAIPMIPGDGVRFAFVGPETPDSDMDFATAGDPRIIRAGKVGEPEKWGWLAAADVLCLPSVSEILPVSILEAWRMETPVVVARGRFTRDLVADAKDGLLCEGDASSVAKAVEEALAGPERMRAMGRAGAAKVAARYEPATVVAQHETLYATLA